MTAVSRVDVTDNQQTQLENAEFDNSVAAFENGETRIIVKDQGGAARVAHATGSINSNAGVMMPFSDKPGRFTEETQGKA